VRSFLAPFHKPLNSNVISLMDVTLTQDGAEVTILDGPYLADGKPIPQALQDHTAFVIEIEMLKGFAADKLLDLYNSTWVNEEIGEVDRSGFIQRLAHRAVHLYDKIGSAAIFFNDGGLFADHFIEVSIDNGKPVDANIAS
jgi:hypothetical protein